MSPPPESSEGSSLSYATLQKHEENTITPPVLAGEQQNGLSSRYSALCGQEASHMDCFLGTESDGRLVDARDYSDPGYCSSTAGSYVELSTVANFP